MDSTSPSVSFIGIVDFTEDACWMYCSESVHDLLGFEPHELIGTSSLDLVHPDEFSQTRAIHYSTITQDQAAVLVYLRLRHKDPCKGYVLCAISRTVCQNVLVGSVSFASPGPKAMHNASTAQEVTIITPTAKDFEFRRWGDPNPMPPCAVPANLIPPDAPPTVAPMRFAPLPEQSVRTALILDRFSMHCPVLYCSNDSIVSTTHVMSRSFFDFVAKHNEELVRSWIDVIKSWGVNERGQPSDGGFGFGKFTLLIDGRDSSEHGSRAHAHTSSRRQVLHGQSRSDRNRTNSHSSSQHPSSLAFSRQSERERRTARDASKELVVDAIFSAHSDGLMVILRPSNPMRPSPQSMPILPGLHPLSATSSSTGSSVSASPTDTRASLTMSPLLQSRSSSGSGSGSGSTPGERERERRGMDRERERRGSTADNSEGRNAGGQGLGLRGVDGVMSLNLDRNSLTLPPILPPEQREQRERRAPR